MSTPRSSSWAASLPSSTAARRGPTTWTCSFGGPIEPAAVEALVTAGYRLDPTPSSWCSKLWMNDVFLDAIYTSSGPIELDVAMLERGEWAEVWDRRVPVLGPEDLVVTKALAHGEETDHYWWDALAIIAKGELDWYYVLMRARRGPRRILSLPGREICNDVEVVDLAPGPDADDVS